MFLPALSADSLKIAAFKGIVKGVRAFSLKTEKKGKARRDAAAKKTGRRRARRIILYCQGAIN